MKSKKILLFLYLFMSINLMLNCGIDALTEYKLRLLEDYKVDKKWNYMERDQYFFLKYECTDAFIKMPTCLKIYNGKLLIVDNMKHQIKVFSKKGNFLYNLGQHGAGPGDLASPIWLELYKGKLYILSNYGIDIYNSKLKFEKRIRTFMSISNFFINNDHIYGGIFSIYKEKYPFFIKMNMNGKVAGFALEEDLKDRFLRKIKDNIFILFIDDQIIIVPKHWNKIYWYKNDLNFKKKIKVKYPLLDKIEKWNDKRAENNKKNSRIVWPCYIIASAKIFNGKLYLLLNIPRLEILVLSPDGNVENHFYNDNDFQLMKWIDFDIQEEKEKIIFYILGYSLDDEKTELSDYNIYKMFAGKKNKNESNNK